MESMCDFQACNILALDIGLKRIGLATMKEGIILPLSPIIRLNRNQAAKELSALLEMREIHLLIIGLPSNETTKKRVMHFVNLLDFSGQIHYVNEDFSSVDSLKQLSHLRKKSRAKARKDGRLDSLSACEILQRFISSKS